MAKKESSFKMPKLESVTGSKYSTRTVTKQGKADKRTKLGGNYKGK